jgi:hypothetical protein
VAVESQIDIDNTGSIYPPILLIDDDSSSGGTLQATMAIGVLRDVLTLQNGARVTLAGGLVLEGLEGTNSTISARGVYVGGTATFTMNGGVIRSGDSTALGGGTGRYSGSGGGVAVDGGTFTMDAGEISDNRAYYGGGVAIRAGGTFTMNGGKISDNHAFFYGGGVYVYSGTFTMNGGEIAGNFTTSNTSGGGGVFVRDTVTATFVKVGSTTGGTIYGYISGDLVNSNVASGKGDAIYYGSNSYRNNTAGPTVSLYFNDPVEGTKGW